MKSASLPDKGFIQVYTGRGKGKTTAALGLSLRAVGNGLSVFIGQFMKGLSYGECKAVEVFGDRLVIERFGEESFVHPDAPRKEDYEKARKGLRRIREVMLSGNYDLVVLDEINVTVSFGILTEKDVLECMDEKPDGVELVLTGIRAPSAFIDRADLVTEMNEIRHYYAEKGIPARRGIEL